MRAPAGGVPAGPLLPGDNPQAYLPGDRRRALVAGVELPRRTRGAALFVDISGFTSFTEALVREVGGSRGAEEIGVMLQRVVSALTEPLHRWDGSIIYFSGDAITAWIDADDGARAVACAVQMQDVMTRVGTLTTPGGTSVTLRLKVAVAVGEVHRFVVGVPEVQLIDVLAGSLMDSLAAAEQVAEPGDVLLDRGALESLGDRVRLRETRHGTSGRVGVLDALLAPPVLPPVPPALPRLPDDVTRQWLLPPVWERMRSGHGEFLTDLRHAVPVFVHFGGLDFERDARAAHTLDDFVSRAQVALSEQGGSLLQLTIGDKGAYLYAVFGAPVAHEDDAVRACAGALRLLEIAGQVPVTDVRVGVATGRLRCGTYGHRERRTFCCLGDAVNLSARLMGKAPDGGVLVHEEVAAATADRFTWAGRSTLAVKGRDQEVAVRVLTGRQRGRRAGRSRPDRTALVGREAELVQLRGLWSRARDGVGQLVVVQAEAGTGKSRLVGRLLEELAEEDVVVADGEAAALVQSPYAVWRGVWFDVLGLDPAGAEPSEVTAAVTRLDPGLTARAPLLAPVLGLPLPDSPLTAGFDGELRHTSLEDLLGRLLVARARRDPLVVVLEDAHWMDPVSRHLLPGLSSAAARSPVLVVATSRPDGHPYAGLEPGRRIEATDLPLRALGPEAATELAAARFRQVGGREPGPDTLSAVVDRADGIPFYLEQLVDFVVAHEADDTRAAGALELPASLHSLVLSRIDAQPEGPRRTVRIASVIGRTFEERLVLATYPAPGPAVVHDTLGSLTRARLVDLEDPGTGRYAFGHSVTQEVAYDSLPFSVRTVLHGHLARALESSPRGPDRDLDLLAHHYGLSDDPDKKRHYLGLAADAAMAAYANRTAIGYLEQLLPLLEPDQRAAAFLKLARAREVDGDWAAAEEAIGEARAAAEEQGDVAGTARARTALADLVRRSGRPAEADEELDRAETAFRSVRDDAGVAQVLHLRGTLASQRGHAEAAREAYEASLELRTRLGDEAGVAALLTNLALVAEDQGDLGAAQRLGQDGLARRRALGDQRAVSVSLTNLGMLATAREDLRAALECFEEAQALAEEVGDPWLVAVGSHNLGNVERDLGRVDAAGGHFAGALEAYAERDDLWSLAHLLEDVALLLLATGQADDTAAVFLLAGAGQLRDQIGTPRFPPTELALEAALAPARSRTAAAALDRAAAAGRRADLPDLLHLTRSRLPAGGPPPGPPEGPA